MKKPIPFGKYYLLKRISVGGMAEVFKAKAFGVEGFERLIAVKRILPSIAEDEEFITMFIDEAKIAVQLQHANIAQIFDLGKVGDSYFIALEYVPGRDLRTIFDRMRKVGRTIPLPMAAYITMKLCEGLDYAHNKKDAAGRDLNLVHRDVSPQNILVSYDGELKIIDFGIAKAAGKAGKTQAGILKGKFGYMSPEQVRGLPLDRRSDIFSVGICLWEMITGERLFMGESDFSTLEKVRNVEITPPSTYNKLITDDLEKVVLNALKKEVEDRYQTAMDIHDEIQGWMYSSGNFFARKDLAAFMREMFSADIEKEAATEGGSDLERASIPPPPKVASKTLDPTKKPPRLSAPPPPPRATQPPPPPRLPRPTGTGQQAVAMATKRIAEGQQQSADGTSRPGARLPEPSPGPSRQEDEKKRTLLGMPSMRPPAPPGAMAPAAAGGRVGAPSPRAEAEVGMEDWDDDEPPTSIYGKKAAAEIAQAAIAPRAHGGAAPASARRPSSRFDEEVQEISSVEEIEESSTIRPIKPAKRSLLPVVVGVVSAVFVLAIGAVLLWLLMFKQDLGGLVLQIDPKDQLKIVVDGVNTLPDNASPLGLNKLEPGKHMIKVSREGYKEKEIDVLIQPGQTLSKEIALERIASGFFLETDPPGASVSIDDRPLEDKTPVTVTDLKPGKYMIRISKGEAYDQMNIEVEVAQGEVKQLPLKKLALKEVEITFNTDPQGAKAILISGNTESDLGLTPAKSMVDTSKEYKIKYQKDGYEELIAPLEYSPDNDKISLNAAALVEKGPSRSSRPTAPASTVSSQAVPPPPPAAASSQQMGSLSVQTRPWSKVSINGQFIKNTPLVNYNLKPGTYTIEVENPTYNVKKTYRVKIQSGKSTTLVKALI